MGVSPKKSRAKIVLALTVMLIAVLAVAYFLVTYPRVLVDFTVSFTIGADSRRVEFEVPFLHDYVKVEVYVSSGNALWNAKILSGDETLWSHSAQQSGQTTYSSEWIKLSSGRYNFTFATAGLGSLEAKVKLTSKGGFW
ncbi:MAG: hypothetical protein ACPL1Z_01850 [Candidatus Bathyarchaeales archaeon]